LQQRGVEFSQLFGTYNNLRESLLERMPAMTINKMNGSNANGDIIEETLSVNSEKVANNNNINTKSNTDALLDLLGSGDDIIMTSNTPAVALTNSSSSIALSSAPIASNNLLDLLGDLDLNTTTQSNPVMNNNNTLTSPINNTMSILDDNDNTNISDNSTIFNVNGGNGAKKTGSNYDLGLDFLTYSAISTMTTSLAATNMLSANTITAFDKNDVVVTLSSQRQNDYVQIVMNTTNNSMDTLEQYLFQVSNQIIKL
jgi:AP-1 complex subunit gamma-1